MGKIIMFLKRYKVYLIIGIILGLILIFLLWISSREELGEGYSSRMERIQSPYVIQDVGLSVDLQGNRIEIPKKDRILKVLGFNIEVIESFVTRYYPNHGELNYTKELSLQFGEKDFFLYTPSSGIFSILSEKGLKVDIDIYSEDTLKIFLTEYFNVQNVSVLETETTGNETKYRGRLLLKNMEIGSSYIDGYAFLVNLDEKGSIKSMSILLIGEDNIKEYQYLPVVGLDTLVQNSKYPRRIGKIDIEERFYERPLPYTTPEVYITDIQYLYLFNDIESGYVLPTYRVSGNGRVINIENEKFWSEIDIFICAIDPEYLTPREVKEIESIGDEPSPYLPPESE